MVTTTRLYSVAEFFDFIAQNPEHDYELIAGEITEVVSDGYESRVALRVGSFIERFVDDNDLGRVTGADGGYMVAGKPYSPDLAVEVLSPTDDNLDVKVANYLAAGTVSHPSNTPMLIHSTATTCYPASASTSTIYSQSRNNQESP